MGAIAEDERDGAVPIVFKGLPYWANWTAEVTTQPYILVYNASDAAGNWITATRTLEVGQAEGLLPVLCEPILMVPFPFLCFDPFLVVLLFSFLS